MNLYKSLRIFSFDVLNTLDNTEILPSSIFFYGKKAASIHIVGVNVNNEVLEILQFGLTVIVIAQKFFHKLGFSFFERDVIRVAAKNVLELAFQLIDIVIRLSTEFKFNFFISCLGSFLLFSSFVEIFAQVVNDSIVMVPVFFPKLTELLLICLHNFKYSISDLEAIFQKSFNIFFFVIIFVDGEISFSFIEPDVWRVNVVVLQQSFLDVSEGNSLFLIN